MDSEIGRVPMGSPTTNTKAAGQKKKKKTLIMSKLHWIGSKLHCIGSLYCTKF